jgi:hypothetical protein
VKGWRSVREGVIVDSFSYKKKAERPTLLEIIKKWAIDVIDRWFLDTL